MIAIIDYQMGNLRSVQKGFERVGHAAAISSDLHTLAQADKLVLPGVGAFADAIAELRRRELVPLIKDAIDAGKPVLGVCLCQQGWVVMRRMGPVCTGDTCVTHRQPAGIHGHERNR